MQVQGHLTLLPNGESQVKNLVLERFNVLPEYKNSETGRVIFCDGFIYLNNGINWIPIGKEFQNTGSTQKTLKLDITSQSVTDNSVYLPNDLDCSNDYMLFFEGRRIFNNRDFSVDRSTNKCIFFFQYM